MYPEVGDNTGKPVLIPHVIAEALALVVKAAVRFRIGPPPISLLVRSWLTKATIGSWSERMVSHTGTEIRPRLLRGAAV